MYVIEEIKQMARKKMDARHPPGSLSRLATQSTWLVILQ